MKRFHFTTITYGYWTRNYSVDALNEEEAVQKLIDNEDDSIEIESELDDAEVTNETDFELQFTEDLETK
jgi:hypothetical protein